MIRIRPDQELIEEYIKNMRASLTCALSRNVEAVTKSCEKIATFAPAPIPSFADGATRRPLTTSVLQENDKDNKQPLKNKRNLRSYVILSI